MTNLTRFQQQALVEDLQQTSSGTFYNNQALTEKHGLSRMTISKYRTRIRIRDPLPRAGVQAPFPAEAENDLRLFVALKRALDRRPGVVELCEKHNLCKETMRRATAQWLAQNPSGSYGGPNSFSSQAKAEIVADKLLWRIEQKLLRHFGPKAVGKRYGVSHKATYDCLRKIKAEIAS